MATGLSRLADGGEHPSDCAPAPSTLTLKEVVALGIGPGIPVSHDHVGFPPVMSVAGCNCRSVHEDFDRCYRAVQSKDARFDGWFVTAVRTTGVYCRPGYTTRQLQRLPQAETGAGPLALARAQRTQTARILVETTDLPFGDIAFAAGFSSIRQFNDTL